MIGTAIHQKFQDWSTAKSEENQNARAQERADAAIRTILERMPRIQNLPDANTSLVGYVGRHQKQESWGGWLKQGAAKAYAKTSYGTEFNRDIVTPYRNAVEEYVKNSLDILAKDKESLIQQVQTQPIGKLDTMEHRGSLQAVTGIIESVFETAIRTKTASFHEVFLQEEKKRADGLKVEFKTEIEHCLTEAKNNKYEMYSGEQPLTNMPTFSKALTKIAQFDKERPLLKKALTRHLKGKPMDLSDKKVDKQALNEMVWALSYFSDLREPA